ncbi:MAG: PspC domain-containing protein [bacterium]|nr:PspC domain-containing protein [bacterium]
MNITLPKKLYRSRNDRVLFGVCGGLAEYTGLNVILIRFIFSVLFFVYWVGLVLYILGIIFVKSAPKSEKTK